MFELNFHILMPTQVGCHGNGAVLVVPAGAFHDDFNQPSGGVATTTQILLFGLDIGDIPAQHFVHSCLSSNNHAFSKLYNIWSLHFEGLPFRSISIIFAALRCHQAPIP